jgi:SNF2 family DNA or RNA helicase
MEEFTLRPYQERDTKIMIANGRILNANEPGLGKTLETLYTAWKLGSKKILVISPKIATGVWLQEAEKWFGWKGMVLTGDFKPAMRKKMRREFIESELQFLAINYAMLKETQLDLPEWETIIIDEIHLGGLLNEKTATFKQCDKLKSKNLFLLTGTPVRKGPQDLYAPLHLLAPDVFKSYWQFVNRYCIVLEGRFGKEIMGRPKDPVRFKQMTRKYMVRNLKKDVLDDLPEKQREQVPVDMTPKQAEAYNEVLEEMMLTSGEEIILTPGALTQSLRLRQLLVCPRILGVDDDGGAIEALTDYLIPEQFEAKRAVVVATVFKTAIPFIKDAIRHKIPGVKIFEIHGDIKEPAANVALKFQQCEGYRKVLIYTIKAGASWTAHTASTGFFLGAEWSCNDNLQAEDRIHRLGQKNKVQIKYLLAPGTIDDIVRSRLDNKNMASNWILQPNEVLKRIAEMKEAYKEKYHK